MKRCDLVVIGAGPAGMSAAILAAKHGASVTVLDEQPEAGGQIYRNLSLTKSGHDRVLGSEYMAGMPLLKDYGQQTINHISGTVVWDVTEEGCVAYSKAGTAYRIQGKYVLVATGALERPFPIKGWTLPGVMTVGAAQIMMKTAGLAAQQAVLVGAGPLLYLVAAQMIAAKTPPLALVETTASGSTMRAARHLGGALLGWQAIAKGLGLLNLIRKAGVKRYTRATEVEILGAGEATGIRFSSSGQSHEIDCSTVLLHLGVVPNTQITRSLRLDHVWSDIQRCFHPVRSDWGMSSCRKIYVAGDGAGIGGAKVAEYSGQISAGDILLQLDLVDKKTRDALTRKSRKARHRDLAVRPFLDALYAPPESILRPDGDVVICRCEEVTATEIRAHARNGCTGPNQTKAFSRAGMGPCQGRYCGLTVTELLAQENQTSPETVGAYRIRAPLKPVTLGEVAALAEFDIEHETKAE